MGTDKDKGEETAPPFVRKGSENPFHKDEWGNVRHETTVGGGTIPDRERLPPTPEGDVADGTDSGKGRGGIPPDAPESD